MPENSHIAGWPKWVTPQAVDRYVYVLTADSVTGDDVVFWAKVEGQTIPVQRRAVSPFLAEHQERIFITHDAVGFHERCVGCVGDEQRQIVWELSLNHQLWDVTLLDRRIRFAHKGYDKKDDSGDALASFLPLLDQVTVASVDECLDALRTCFDGQVHWALENLPLFRTYSRDIPPTPLTTDEFCDCLDSSLEGIIIYQRYLEELLMPPVGTTHPAQEGVDDEMEDDAEFHSVSPSPPASTQDDFAIALAFRRRDIVLTSNTGPFGVGLDVAGAIVTALSKKVSQH